jgi:hypothetical protein
MKTSVRSTVFAVIVIASIGVLTATTLVEASRDFHGTYAWTGARSCVLSSQAFVGSSFLIPEGAFLSRQNSTESGTITFNDDGTGVTAGRASFITITTTAGAGLSVAEFENRFTFIVNSDATIDTESTGVSAVTVLGTGVGGTSTGIGLRNRFQIVRGDMIVTAPQTAVSLEKVFLPSGVTLHRICTPHNFTATRLP